MSLDSRENYHKLSLRSSNLLNCWDLGMRSLPKFASFKREKSKICRVKELLKSLTLNNGQLWLWNEVFLFRLSFQQWQISICKYSGCLGMFTCNNRKYFKLSTPTENSRHNKKKTLEKCVCLTQKLFSGCKKSIYKFLVFQNHFSWKCFSVWTIFLKICSRKTSTCVFTKNIESSKWSSDVTCKIYYWKKSFSSFSFLPRREQKKFTNWLWFGENFAEGNVKIFLGKYCEGGKPNSKHKPELFFGLKAFYEGIFIPWLREVFDWLKF